MNHNWKNLVLIACAGTAVSGCQNCQSGNTSVSRKPLGQRMFGTLGKPANQQTMPPYVPSSTLPGGLPPGAVATPPPGAVIIGANGAPIANPGAPMGYPPSTPFGAAPPSAPYGAAPIGAPSVSGSPISAPSAGPGTPFPPSGYAMPPSQGPLPPAVSTNPAPSPTGPINSQSKRFSNEELQNSVRLGIPEVGESRSVEPKKIENPLAAPSAPTTEPPLAPSNPNANTSPGATGGQSVAPSATMTPSPLDIPRFIRMRSGLAVGRQPFPDGITWLKDAGYRKVVHVAGPAELDEAARKLFEREGIQYIRLELDPAKMDRAQIQQFAGLIRPVGNEQIFVFDRDGTRLGSAWLAERVLEEKADLGTAKIEADNIGFALERLPEQDPVRQNLVKLLKPS